MTGPTASPGQVHPGGMDEGALSRFAGEFDGELLRPSDGAYAEACQLWNGMIQRRPALVARPANTSDVQRLVQFARQQALPISVRGGGHNVAGTALVDAGVVIDLSSMRVVEVDPAQRRVRAQGGAKLGDVDRATSAHGLAVPVGVVSRTGVAGLTLHGGLGLLTRKHGLTCDNLIGAEVVTADGEVVRADATRNPDLLWALRGGGGNFGVVTSLEYRAHPIGREVFLFLVMYPLDEALPVMRAFRSFMANAPPEVMGLGILWNTPEADPVPEGARNVPAAILVGAHSGPLEEAERAVAPLRALATPLADLSGPVPYLEAQQLFDPDYPDGRRYYWKAIYLSDLGDDAILALVEHARRRPSPISSIDIWALGGALRNEPEGGSAFAQRSAPFMLGIEANWDDATQDAANVEWARALHSDMRRFSDGGAYLNFPGFAEEGEDMLRSAYGRNYDQLRAIKAKYDPENVFRSNFNIAPVAPAR